MKELHCDFPVDAATKNMAKIPGIPLHGIKGMNDILLLPCDEGVMVMVTNGAMMVFRSIPGIVSEAMTMSEKVFGHCKPSKEHVSRVIFDRKSIAVVNRNGIVDTNELPRVSSLFVDIPVNIEYWLPNRDNYRSIDVNLRYLDKLLTCLKGTNLDTGLVRIEVGEQNEPLGVTSTDGRTFAILMPSYGF